MRAILENLPWLGRIILDKKKNAEMYLKSPKFLFLKVQIRDFQIFNTPHVPCYGASGSHIHAKNVPSPR